MAGMKWTTGLVLAGLAGLCVSARGGENRLAKEKSPYLQQHAHNPVDWYPWGEEAFAKAKAENKPVFLSIGYSTCHWCHVMERESFENEKVAKFMNEHFVCIKVDREERPDVDGIYITAVQAMTQGNAGWPLNVFLTPERKPFFGGTYFPPETHGRSIGFQDLLGRVSDMWAKSEADIRKDSETLSTMLNEGLVVKPEPGAAGLLKPELIPKGAAAVMKTYDAKDGGFGTAPKFPQPSVVALVLRQAVTGGDAAAQAAVVHTLKQMAAGGMYDQVGDGFARYSTDAKWLVPHFEKMLYDNAQLASLYLDASVAFKDPASAEVARGIFRYVLRDMTHAAGGFFSAEDADSEGQEGKFYCWTLEELTALLTPEELAAVVAVWGVTKEGNFVDHSNPKPLPDLNVLSVVEPGKKQAPEVAAALGSARKKLFDVRAKRVRPHRDDKVLVSWNGLMLSALARGYVVLGDDALLAAARKNFSWVKQTLWDEKTKTLAHRWRDGEADKAQLLKGYACYLQGALDLYQVTLDPEVLAFSRSLGEGMMEKFYDAKDGGFYDSTAAGELIVRLKEKDDNAEPSGNGVAVRALLQLSAITDQPALKEKAEKSLQLFAKELSTSPEGAPGLLQGLALTVKEPFRVVIAGDPASAEVKSLVKAAWSVYQPDKVVLGNAGPVEDFAKTLTPKDGKAAAYVCTGKECRLPTSDPAVVAGYLKAGPAKKE